MPSLNPSPTIPILLITLLLTQSFQADSFSLAVSLTQYKTLISLTHSLLTRVANLRSSRGDYEGAQRATHLASKLEGSLSLWDIGWDYTRSYAEKDMTSPIDMFATVADVNQLLKALTELTRLKSAKDTTDWVARNYQGVFSAFKSLSQRLLKLKVSYRLLLQESNDYESAHKAGQLASKLEGSPSLWKVMWNIGWDYYAWQDMTSPADMFAAVADVNWLLKALNELTRLKSTKDTIDWVARNYQGLFRGFKSLTQPGPLRDLALEIQREVNGDLLRDCIEIGSNDLKGLVQIIKDLAVHFSMASDHTKGDL